jgi:hypothetical protein
MVVLFCITTKLARAQEPISSAESCAVPFNAAEIIEQIAHHPSTPYAYDGNRFENRIVTEWSREHEFLIDTNVVYAYGPSIGNQWSVSIAFDGTNYLVVWQDDRNGSCDIYGTRIAQSGVVLDPVGIAISTAANDQLEPSVAFDGTNYLVVWQDDRNGSCDIYGTRVAQSGVVLDPVGIAISTAADDQLRPSVAFDGTNYLAVWQDHRNEPYKPDICGARVDTSGSILDSTAITVSTATYHLACPSIAFDGTRYLVVWSRGFYICGARVDQSGSVLDTPGIIIGSANDQLFEYSPSIAFDGINYLVAWTRKHPRFYWTSDICGARVDTAGNVLDPGGIDICTIGESQWLGSVAFDGTNYLLVWQDCGIYFPASVWGARVNTSGTVLDTTFIVIASGWIGYGEPRSPSVAFGARTYLVVWEDDRNAYIKDIYGTRLRRSGAIIDTLNICMSTQIIDVNEQRNPAVSFDGTNYLVTWEEDRITSYDIYGARVDQSGNVLDADAIAISTPAVDQLAPSVAFDGTNYLVVWKDERNGYWDIYGTRVDQSGIVLDPVGIAISIAMNEQSAPSISCDGTNYLVVWEDWRYGSSCDIYGARVDQSGNVLDTAGIVISTAANKQYSPSIAFDGTNFLVVWADGRNDPMYPDTYGARVDTSGNVLDPFGIAISTAPNSQWRPSVTFDGTNYLVVWEDERNGWPLDIYGARVDQSGNVLDSSGIAISTASNNQMSPSVAFDGTNYLVVWREWRSNSWDIYGAKLNTSGVVIDTFVVSLQLGYQTLPTLAHGTGDQYLITYSGWTESINGQPVNTMRIWGKFYPLVGIEDNDEFTIHDTKFGLHVYPNPFSNRTQIRYTIHDPEQTIGQLTMKICDATGRIVKTFCPTPCSATQYGGLSNTTSWNGVDAANRKLPGGVYFLTLSAGDYSATEKLLLIR